MKLYSNDKEIACKVMESIYRNDERSRWIELECAPFDDMLFQLFKLSFDERREKYIYIDEDKSKRYIIRDLHPLPFDIDLVLIHISLLELPEHLWRD